VLLCLINNKCFIKPRYFIGYLNGATQWAYPLDICTQIGITGYQMVSCDSTGTKAIVNSYNDACKTLKKQVNYTSSDITPTGLYDFNCVGTNDYVASNINVASCTTPIATITAYGVVNACFGLKFVTVANTTLAYQNAQCNATHAIVNLYVSGPSYSSTYGCSALYSVAAGTSYLNQSCEYYYTFGGLTIYAQVTDCVYNGYSQIPQYYDNSADFTASSYTLAANYTLAFDVSPSAYAISIDAPLDLCGYDWEKLIETNFPGCKFMLETQCTTYASDFDDTDLASIYVWASVMCYTSSSSLTKYPGCSSYNVTSMIGNANMTVSGLQCSSYIAPTTTAAPSVGYTQGINFIVLATGFLISLYIF